MNARKALRKECGGVVRFWRCHSDGDFSDRAQAVALTEGCGQGDQDTRDGAPLRDQSPHYIPELDPEHPDRRRDIFGFLSNQRILWGVLAASVGIFVLGAGLVMLGFSGVGLTIAVIGVLLLGFLILPFF